MNITVFHFIGILITLILVAAVGIYSGSKVKNASDFTNGGGKSGSLMVCGVLILALFYVIPLRSSSHVTLLQVISDEYGESAEYLGPAAVLIGRFLPMPFDSLFLGIAVCLICCMAGRK